jgi:hypothetical protein
MPGKLSQMVETPEILLPALLIDSIEPWHPGRTTSYALVRVVFQQILDFSVGALSWRCVSALSQDCPTYGALRTHQIHEWEPGRM